MIDILNNIPAELTVFFISMLPISELRGSIPIAIEIYDIDPIKAYVLAVFGNMIPVILILKYIDFLSIYLMSKSKILKNFFLRVFEKTRNKHNKKFNELGSLALVFFVAVPLPATGGWSGALAAFVFGIPLKKALPLIFLGVIISGIIVTGLSIGILGHI